MDDIEEITVYRIENDQGEGCYRFETNACDWWDGWEDFDQHPVPQRDGIADRDINDDYFCGFKSLEDLNKWFTQSELNKLDTLGFTIKSYYVLNKDVLFGYKQLMFNKELAYVR